MLKDQLIAKCGPETVDEKMQDLAWDDDGDDPASSLHTPVKGQGPRTRARKKESAPALAEKVDPPMIGTLEMQSLPDATLSPVHVCVTWADKKLWIALPHIPWLVQYVAAEKATGGVAPVIPETEDQGKSGAIRWNFRDNTWQARCRRADGSWVTNTKGVHKRIALEGDPLFQCNFQAAKQAVYEELEKWVRSHSTDDEPKP
jgi:hypothetical protein